MKNQELSVPMQEVFSHGEDRMEPGLCIELSQGVTTAQQVREALDGVPDHWVFARNFLGRDHNRECEVMFTPAEIAGSW